MKVIICIVVVVFGVMEISKYGNKQKRALGTKRQKGKTKTAVAWFRARSL